MRKGISGGELITHGLYGVFTQMIGNVPVVGGAILGMIDGIQQYRAAQFLEDLRQQVMRLGEDKLDRGYIESEEFSDLLCQAIEARARHRSKMKAKMLVSLVTESMTHDRHRTTLQDSREIFISILDSLTDSEVRFLSDFVKGEFTEKTRSDIYSSDDPGEGICLDGLIAKGVLSMSEAWNQHIEETALGRELIGYLRLLNEFDCG